MGCSSSIPFFGVNVDDLSNCETFFLSCKDVISEGFKDTSDLFHDYLSLHRKAESSEEKTLEKELKKLVNKINKIGNFELIKTTPIITLVPMLLVYFFEALPSPFLPHHFLDRFITSYYEDSKSDEDTKTNKTKMSIERIEYVKLQFFQNLFSLSDNSHLILTNTIDICKTILKFSSNSTTMKKQLSIVFLPIFFRDYPNNDEILFEVYNIMFDLLINNWGNEKPINELLNEKENEIIKLIEQLNQLSDKFENYKKEIRERYAPRQLHLLYIYVFHSWRYVTKRRKLKVYIDYLKNQNVTLSSTINTQHHTIRETMKRTELISKTRNGTSLLPPYYGNNNTSKLMNENTDRMRDKNSKTSFLKNNENIYADSMKSSNNKERKKRNTLGGLKKSIGKIDNDNLNTSSFYEKSPMLLHTLHSNPLLPNTINLNDNNDNRTISNSIRRNPTTDSSIYIPMKMKMSEIMNKTNNYSNDEEEYSNDIVTSPPPPPTHIKQLQYDNDSNNNNNEYENIPSSILPPPSPTINDNNNIITTKKGIYTKESTIMNNNDEDDNIPSSSSSSDINDKIMLNNMNIIDNRNDEDKNEESPNSTPTLVSEKKFSSNNSEIRITTNSVPQEPLISISDSQFRNSVNVDDNDDEFGVHVVNDTHY